MIYAYVARLISYNHAMQSRGSGVAKKLANILDTTVGYLLGETEQADLFKDKKMLQRLQDILKLPEKEQSSILLTLDHFIKSAKISLM